MITVKNIKRKAPSHSLPPSLPPNIKYKKLIKNFYILYTTLAENLPLSAQLVE